MSSLQNILSCVICIWMGPVRKYMKKYFNPHLGIHDLPVPSYPKSRVFWQHLHNLGGEGEILKFQHFK